MRTELYLPLKTVSALNVREHWAARARRVKRERAAVLLALHAHGSQLRAFCDAPHIRVTLTRGIPPRGRVLDTDNLAAALKGVRDAIAAWFHEDDGSGRWEWEYRQEKQGSHGVGLTFEALAAEGVA